MKKPELDEDDDDDDEMIMIALASSVWLICFILYFYL